jgi:L-seryl-tRNA(Ser) seleniumtransferase/D-glucosaminate-6-phosphate ammonia-lyase
MVPLEDVIDIGKKCNVPIIVDVAAEEDLKKYLELGADLVIYSGGKAISGPTSGFIAGKKELIKNCKLQYQGIGRAMKVSKESIVGLVKAMEIYCEENHDEEPKEQRKMMEWLMEKINKIDGLRSSVEKDEANREIYRLKISVNKERFGMDAKDIIEHLKNGDPQVFTRNHYANIGLIYIDPRPLNKDDEKEIFNRFTEISKIGKEGKNNDR